jgi:hypothetical protein
MHSFPLSWSNGRIFLVLESTYIHEYPSRKEDQRLGCMKSPTWGGGGCIISLLRLYAPWFFCWEEYLPVSEELHSETMHNLGVLGGTKVM